MDFEFDVLKPQFKHKKDASEQDGNLIDLSSIPSLVPNGSNKVGDLLNLDLLNTEKPSNSDNGKMPDFQHEPLPIVSESVRPEPVDSIVPEPVVPEPVEPERENRNVNNVSHALHNNSLIYDEEDALPERTPSPQRSPRRRRSSAIERPGFKDLDRLADTKLKCSIFEVVAPYCDVQSLIALSSVSREARNAAIADDVWKPICEDIGFANKQQEPSLVLVASDDILEQGYIANEQFVAYKTFVRAFKALYPAIHSSETACKKMGFVEKAITLGNASSIASVVYVEMPAALSRAVAKSKEELLSRISSLLAEKKTPIDISYFQAADTWLRKTKDHRIKEKVLGLYFADVKPKLVAQEAFAIVRDAVNDNMHKQVSQTQLDKNFNNVAASLVTAMAEVNSPQSSIPISWKEYTLSLILSHCMAAVVVYLQEILQIAANEVSELEYLNAVPKIYAASRGFCQNSALQESVGETEFDMNTYVELTMMRPILEEFAERQVLYVEHYARDKVKQWNESMAQKETEMEQLLWSSVPRKSDKNKFISSFKWAFLSADDAEDHAFEEGRDPSLAVGSALDQTAPQTAFEAQTAVLISKLKGMESMVSLELAINALDVCRAAIHRLKVVGKASSALCQSIFCSFLTIVGKDHIRNSFQKAIDVLNAYDPKRYGRLLISVQHENSSSGSGSGSGTSGTSDHEDGIDSFTSPFAEAETEAPEPANRKNAVEPLAVFTELMNIGDLVQQMVHLFFEEELVGARLVGRNDFGAPSFNAKRKFEQMLDDMLAEGLSRGIDVLLEQVEFTLLTEQLGSDYMPLPSQPALAGPTPAACKVIDLVRSHLDLLRESTEKTLFDVFQQEVGLRLYASLTKHIKRQHISIDGAISLVSDVNAYYAFIASLRQKNLLPYYETLKQISQLFLIEPKYAKQIGLAMSDSARYNGLVTTEELVEMVKRRQDWPIIKPKVEKVLYGIFECIIA